MIRTIRCSVLLLMLTLTACGGSTSGPEPTSTPDQAAQVTAAQNSGEPTIDPNLPPTATVDASCRKLDVEGWVQAEAQHSRALIDLLNTQALITPPEQMGTMLGQVTSTFEQVKLAPQPACAQKSIDLVVGLFEMVITQLTSYSTGQQVDLVKLVADANATYALIKAEDQGLRQLYASLPRE